MKSQEQTVLMPLRNFPLQDYSRNALESFVREYTSPHWDEILVLHNHYVIFNDYDENIDDFATKLYRALKKEKPETFSGIITEEVLLSNPQRLQQKAFNRNYFLFVTDCKDSEMGDEDRAQWEAVRKITETPNAPTIFLVTTREIFEKRFRGNDALYHRFFTRETRIVFKEDFAPEEIHSLLNEEIDVQLPFQRTDEFDDRLSAYLKDVYPKADLKRQDFIEDMLRRINALYYQNGLDDEFLTEACVPFWNPVVEETSPTATEQEESSDEEPPSEDSLVKEDSVEPAEADIPEKCKNCSKEEQSEDKKTPEIPPELFRIPRFTVNGADSNSNDAENILILALSTLTPRGYKETTSKDAKDNEYKYYYQMEPVAQMIQQRLSKSGKKLDKILILASDKTLDPAACEVPIDGDKRLQALDGPEDVICQASALDFFFYRLKEYFGEDTPECCVFKYDNTADVTISNITQPLYQMLSEIRKTPKATLYADIHGGLRQQQQILSGVMSLLEIEGIPVKPTNVFSVEFDENRVSRIVEAGESIQINKFVSGMNELSKYARIGSLKEYIQGADAPDVQELLHTLESISSDIQFCNVAHFEKDFKRLPGNLNAVAKQGANSMLALFLDDVRGTFGKLAEGNISVPDEVMWCMEKGFYQQALSIIEAKMPMYLIENGIIECDDSAEDYIAEKGRFKVYNKLRLYPDILKALTNTIKDVYQPPNKGGVAFSQILQNNEQRIIGSIIKPNSKCKWRYDYIDFTFDTPNAVKLMILHATFKTLRNAMNHPNKNLNFILDSGNVEERITEYLDLAENLAGKSELNPVIHLNYSKKYRPKFDNQNNEIAQTIALFNSDREPQSAFTDSKSIEVPDPKPLENVNPEAVKRYAQMLCTYVQGTGTNVFLSKDINPQVNSYFPGDLLPGKKEIYTSGSGKVLDAVCKSYPDLFRQDDIKIIVTLPSDN